MKVEFKRKLQLNNVIYAIGLSDVPDTLYDDWYFNAMVKEGDIVIVDKKPLCETIDKTVLTHVKKQKRQKD